MKIQDAKFMIGAMSMSQLPANEKPEIALVGRSNVGKSSLINSMLGRRNLARTSNTPGKTRQMNYYLINERFYFVDLPGYGYAKVSKSEQEKWGKLIERYLAERENLLGVLQLIDSRHVPTESDIAMYQWLARKGLYTVVTATKVDKIARGSWQKSASAIRKSIQMLPQHPLILFSAETNYGCEQLWSVISALLDASEAFIDDE